MLINNLPPTHKRIRFTENTIDIESVTPHNTVVFNPFKVVMCFTYSFSYIINRPKYLGNRPKQSHKIGADNTRPSKHFDISQYLLQSQHSMFRQTRIRRQQNLIFFLNRCRSEFFGAEYSLYKIHELCFSTKKNTKSVNCSNQPKS